MACSPPPPPPPPPPLQPFDDSQNYTHASFLHRTRHALHRKSPQLKESLLQSSQELLQWVRRGGFWRASLAIVVGGGLLVALLASCAFVLFIVTAIVNAVAIGLLASVVALAIPFFAVLGTVYIGSLIIAIVTISILPFFSICAALTAGGWLAFVWVVWKGCTVGAHLCKRLALVAENSFKGPRRTGLAADKSFEGPVLS